MTKELDTLFHEFSGDLHRFARTRLGDADAAEDIVQDAFARYAAMLSADGGARAEELSNPKSFLFRIAANLIIDSKRQQVRRKTDTGRDTELYEYADPAPSAENHVMGRQRLKRLNAALNDLPPRRREVFVLARIEGLSYREIGERLGISPQTVYHHMIKALAQINRHMEEPEMKQP